MAKALAQSQGALLLSEDVWLTRLYGDRIEGFDDDVRFSRTLGTVVGPLVVDRLALGQSVIMDFTANTRRRRDGFRSLFEAGQAAHLMHVLQTPDAVCLERIGRRNLEMPEGASRLTEADYWHVTSTFEPPEAAAGIRMQTYPS
jgi:predicted kinase